MSCFLISPHIEHKGGLIFLCVYICVYTKRDESQAKLLKNESKRHLRYIFSFFAFREKKRKGTEKRITSMRCVCV